MTKSNSQQRLHLPRSAEQIFYEAREIPPSEWTAYLKGACTGDGALLVRVESLHKTDAVAGNFLMTRTMPRPPSIPQPRRVDDIPDSPHLLWNQDSHRYFRSATHVIKRW